MSDQERDHFAGTWIIHGSGEAGIRRMSLAFDGLVFFFL